MRYRLLCLFLLFACGEPAPVEIEEEAPRAEPAVSPGIAAKAGLVERQQQLHRRLDSVADAAEGMSAQYRSAWSVVVQKLGLRSADLERGVQQMDPEASDWEETSRVLTADLDQLEKQLEAELGALQRER